MYFTDIATCIHNFSHEHACSLTILALSKKNIMFQGFYFYGLFQFQHIAVNVFSEVLDALKALHNNNQALEPISSLA